MLLPELQLQLERNDSNSVVWPYALAAFLLTMVREIVKDVEDMRGDAQHGCRTLPLVWGVARTKWVAGFFLACLALLTLGATGRLLVSGHWPLGTVAAAAGAAAHGPAGAPAHPGRPAAPLPPPQHWCKGIMLAGVLSMALAGA